MVESLVLLHWKHTIHLPLCLFLHHTIHSLQRALRMPLASGPRLPEMGKRRGGRTANCAPRSTGHTATITWCSSSWRLDPLQRLAAWVLDVDEHGIIKLIEQQSMDSSVQQLARNLTPMKRDCPWNAILALFHTITAGSSRTRPSIGSGQSHGCKAAFPGPHSIARLAWWSCATSLYNGFDLHDEEADGTAAVDGIVCGWIVGRSFDVCASLSGDFCWTRSCCSEQPEIPSSGNECVRRWTPDKSCMLTLFSLSVTCDLPFNFPTSCLLLLRVRWIFFAARFNFLNPVS